VQATHGSHVVIFAGSSQLTYVGGSASATIVGSKGREELSGNATLFGGESGHNRFVAAHGAATMTAGSNSDTFVFSKDAAGGDDVIHHFRQGIDKLDLQGCTKAGLRAARSRGLICRRLLACRRPPNDAVVTTFAYHALIRLAPI
jgi:Ca2+-binding RTX toxin-like protein